MVRKSLSLTLITNKTKIQYTSGDNPHFTNRFYEIELDSNQHSKNCKQKSIHKNNITDATVSRRLITLIKPMIAKRSSMSMLRHLTLNIGKAASIPLPQPRYLEPQPPQNLCTISKASTSSIGNGSNLLSMTESYS